MGEVYILPAPCQRHTIRMYRPYRMPGSYTDERAELVEALREALEGGHSMDHLFSRKRSFRKHIKRYGSAAPVDWKEITASADKPLR